MRFVEQAQSFLGAAEQELVADEPGFRYLQRAQGAGKVVKSGMAGQGENAIGVKGQFLDDGKTDAGVYSFHSPRIANAGFGSSFKCLSLNKYLNCRELRRFLPPWDGDSATFRNYIRRAEVFRFVLQKSAAQTGARFVW